MVTSVAPAQKKSVRFSARSFVAFALTPEAPLGDWLGRLDRWTENSPGFFTGRPVVLDLNVLKPSAGEIRGLVEALGARGIRIYAIEAEGLDAAGEDLPPLLSGAKPAAGDRRDALPAPAADVPPPAASLTIRAPIRSGQSIFHADGDVIVLGSVGSGSEIIAGGSVHIYGTLRGRVFAGATGNPEARIFCRRNEAELMAIDGWYLTADDMEPASRGGPTQAFLDNGAIRIAPLD